MAVPTTPATAPEPPMPWLRAGAFGATCASIGTFGHAAVTGGRVDWVVFVASLVALAAYARIFTSGRISAAAVTLSVIAGQVAVHMACVLTSPMPSHDHGYAEHSAHLAAQAAATPGIPWAMVLVHAAASLVGAILLLRLEVRAWARVATIVARVATLLVAAFRWATDRGAASVAPAVVVVRSFDTWRRRWIVASAARRGPPVLALH